MSSDDETLLSKVAVWPRDVLRGLKQMTSSKDATDRKLGTVRAAIPLIAGFVAQQVYAPGGSNPRDKVIGFYIGAGIGNIFTNYVITMLMAREMCKKFGIGCAKPKANFDAISQYDTLAGHTGPLSTHPLRPIVGYQAMPPLPRYPFGTGAHYSLNQQLDWARARQLGFQAAL